MRYWILIFALLALAGCPQEETASTDTDTQVARTADTPMETPAAEDPAIDTPATETPAEDIAPSPETTPAGMLVGKAAPDFTLTDYDGNTHTLSQYTAEGKIVILEWFSPMCGAVNAYYNAEKPEFMQNFKAGLEGKDVVWLSVNSSGEGKPGYGAEDNKKWMAEHGKDNPILEDASGATGKAYGVQNTPHLFVIDATGTVRYSGSFDEAQSGGEAPKGENYVLTAMNAAINGGEITVKATNAPG